MALLQHGASLGAVGAAVAAPRAAPRAHSSAAAASAGPGGGSAGGASDADWRGSYRRDPGIHRRYHARKKAGLAALVAEAATKRDACDALIAQKLLLQQREKVLLSSLRAQAEHIEVLEQLGRLSTGGGGGGGEGAQGSGVGAPGGGTLLGAAAAAAGAAPAPRGAPGPAAPPPAAATTGTLQHAVVVAQRAVAAAVADAAEAPGLNSDPNLHALLRVAEALLSKACTAAATATSRAADEQAAAGPSARQPPPAGGAPLPNAPVTRAGVIARFTWAHPEDLMLLSGSHLFKAGEVAEPWLWERCMSPLSDEEEAEVVAALDAYEPRLTALGAERRAAAGALRRALCDGGGGGDGGGAGVLLDGGSAEEVSSATARLQKCLKHEADLWSMIFKSLHYISPCIHRARVAVACFPYWPDGAAILMARKRRALARRGAPQQGLPGIAVGLEGPGLRL
ncbi:MAG: hypothetical protein J3K34DRAFT_458807 [Monoraphidium minutum]|nr:MAG: hypothetical protein J3K34DRAFT_458807 [Monoraphidium minutum]